MFIVWTLDCPNGTGIRRRCNTFPIGMEGVSREHPDMLGDRINLYFGILCFDMIRYDAILFDYIVIWYDLI